VVKPEDESQRYSEVRGRVLIVPLPKVSTTISVTDVADTCPAERASRPNRPARIERFFDFMYSFLVADSIG
jgi:hypothetical protein